MDYAQRRMLSPFAIFKRRGRMRKGDVRLDLNFYIVWRSKDAKQVRRLALVSGVSGDRETTREDLSFECPLGISSVDSNQYAPLVLSPPSTFIPSFRLGKSSSAFPPAVLHFL